MSQRNLN